MPAELRVNAKIGNNNEETYKTHRKERDMASNKKVLILTSKYEDEDSEILGAFEDMRALVHGFGEIIANSVAQGASDASVLPACLKVADILADAIPVLCRADRGLEWADDECSDADGAVYGVYQQTVKGITKNK